MRDQKRTVKFVSSVIVLGFILSVSVGVLTQNAWAQDKFVAAGGGVGGGWYTLISGMAEIAKQKAGISIDVVPGGGVSNPGRVASGQVDMSLAMPMLIAAALSGNDPYKKPFSGIEVVAMGFSTNYLHFAVSVDEKVNSVEEIFKSDYPLKVITGRSSTSTGWIFGQILKFYGLTEKDISDRGGKVFHAPYGDWVNMLKDRHVNAMFDNIVIPSPILTEVLLSRKMKLLPLPDDLYRFLVKEKSLAPGIIPTGSYGFVEKDLQTCTVKTGIIANAKTPADIVYKLMKTWCENADQVRSIHKSVKTWDCRDSWKDAGGPLHPGAAKFYKEMGYMK
jgi:TRAP transporter TAXI family solute receptor